MRRPAESSAGLRKIQPALDSRGCESQRLCANSSMRRRTSALLERPVARRRARRTTPFWASEQRRYPTVRSSPAISRKRPSGIRKVTLSTRSQNSPPMAPAFIRRAPPNVPGMPSRNSKPVKPRSQATRQISFNRVPASAKTASFPAGQTPRQPSPARRRTRPS